MRFGKGTLRAAHHLEFNSMTQGSEESVEQWGDRVMEAAQYALGARVSGSVLQEQSMMRFAMGCNDPSAGRQLLDRTPCAMDEAVRRVKTYQLSRQALTGRRGVRSVSLSDKDQSSSPSPARGKVKVTDASSKSPSLTKRGRARRDKPNHSSTNASPKSKTPLCAIRATSRDIFMNVLI